MLEQLWIICYWHHIAANRQLHSPSNSNGSEMLHLFSLSVANVQRGVHTPLTHVPIYDMWFRSPLLLTTYHFLTERRNVIGSLTTQRSNQWEQSHSRVSAQQSRAVLSSLPFLSQRDHPDAIPLLRTGNIKNAGDLLSYAKLGCVQFLTYQYCVLCGATLPSGTCKVADSG